MFDESKVPDLNNNGQYTAHFSNESKKSKQDDFDFDLKKTKNLCELSCNILSLSFLEDEEEIYTLDDLKEKY